MRTVVVVTTGGTIASTSTSSGAKTASVSGATLVEELIRPALPDELAVRAVEVVQVNSYDLGFAEMDAIHAAVRDALGAPDTCGVVITHGTDTLEETAMLVDLFHDDPRPVVLTGAQRSHDDPDNDGPRNLADAVTVAASPAARGHGVLVCFAGAIHAARGTRKVHTSELAAFLDVDRGQLGQVLPGGRVELDGPRPRVETGLREPVDLAGVRVAIVPVHPDVDATTIDAHLAGGVDGLVLEATGYGNANRAIIEGVRRCREAAVPVVLSTRVAGGPVAAVYAGGVALVEAGAVPAGLLRPSQARIQLAALLAAGRDVDEVAAAFA